MPLVRFYTGLEDQPGFAARLLRKALREPLTVWVVGDAEVLRLLSRRLWEMPGFMAHASPGAAATLRQRSRVRMGQGFDADSDCTALLNLGQACAPEPDRWNHVFELVGADPDALRAGRARFRAYVERGIAPQHFDSKAA